jgi:hypothetical protein
MPALDPEDVMMAEEGAETPPEAANSATDEAPDAIINEPRPTG